MSDVSTLTDIDGKNWNTANLADAKVMIVVFTCNECPYSVDYEDRLNTLHRKYVDSGGQVRLLVVNSNTGSRESLAEMSKRAEQKQFSFVYVKDSDQSFARSLGAVYTPECFVFDQDRRLVYKGALDDSTTETNVKVHYVNDAVTAVLAGAPVKTPEAGARGCAIRFKRRRPGRRRP
ncbi:MAG: thioredoxin family protein [Fuerstiella sp.]|nr:thioredoxin family protein [Fuerstiella sp.]